MKRPTNLGLVLVITISFLSLAGCSNNPPAPASPAAATTSAPMASTAPGVSLTADPNPIRVCDGSDLGITSLHWKTPGIKEVEIHVNAPDGPLLTRGHAEGKAETRKWVTNGMVFYLQDATGIDKTPAQRTIGTVTVHLTTEGCP